MTVDRRWRPGVGRSSARGDLLVADEELDGAAVGVLDDDVHLATGGVDEPLQRGQEHVAAAFEAGDLGLVHVEQLTNGRLGELAA